MAEFTQENDKPSLRIVLPIIFYILLLMLFTFLIANGDAQARQTADFYFKFGLLGVVLVIADIAIAHVRAGRTDVELPNTLTHEFKSPFFGDYPRWIKIAVVGGALIAGGLYAQSISQQNIVALISSPKLQAVQLGVAGDAILSGIAGIQEDLVFWGGLAPILLSLLILIFKRKWIPLAIVILLVPTIFMFYHIGIYGENVAALNSVLFFGFIAMIATLITGSLIVAHAIHFANNAAVTFFSATLTDFGLIIWLYLFMVIIITVIVEIKWGFKGGN